MYVHKACTSVCAHVCIHIYTIRIYVKYYIQSLYNTHVNVYIYIYIIYIIIYIYVYIINNHIVSLSLSPMGLLAASPAVDVQVQGPQGPRNGRVYTITTPYMHHVSICMTILRGCLLHCSNLFYMLYGRTYDRHYSKL